MMFVSQNTCKSRFYSVVCINIRNPVGMMNSLFQYFIDYCYNEIWGDQNERNENWHHRSDWICRGRIGPYFIYASLRPDNASGFTKLCRQNFFAGLPVFSWHMLSLIH